MYRIAKKTIKTLLILLVLLLNIFTLSSTPVDSQIIPLYSSFYTDFDTLMVSIGKNANATRPYTVAEANLYLNDINIEKLNGAEKRLYEKLLSEVKSKESNEVMNFDYSLSLNPEIYFHTNTSFSDRVYFLNDNIETWPEYGYENEDKYLVWDRDKPHFMDLDLNLSFANTVTLLFQFPITNTVHTGIPSGSDHFMSNIPFLASLESFSTSNFQDFSMNFPYRANITVAGNWYTLTIGRDRFQYGLGETGNFIIDSSLPYHNAISLSFFTKTFKYNFFASFFPYPDQYINIDENNGSSYSTDLIFDQNEDAFTGIKMFMVHRFDWTMNKGKHRMAITEGIMYQNEEGNLDLQVFNPMMFFHNMYIAGNSNSILQLEYDLSLAKGITQRLAIAIDDFNIPFEDTDGSEKRPNAVGLQYGIRTSHPIDEGFLESNIELTYMSPYFYLRDGKGEKSLPLDFVIAVRNQRSSAGMYDLYTIGYPGGGDQGIAHINISYRVPYYYMAKLSLEYRFFGNNNLMTIYMKGDENGPLTHMLSIKVNGEYHLMSNMKIGLEIEDKMYFNYNNIKNNFQNDFLITVSYNYFF